MADDARISTALPNHPKTVKLQRRLQERGCWALVCLFLWVADNRHDGDLSGMTAEDIEIAAKWMGDAGKFVDALVEVGFLDGDDGCYQIHDWYEHNPFAATKPQRVAAAKEANRIRWEREREAKGMPVVSESDPDRMQDGQKRTPHHTTPHHSTPLPTSTPKREEETAQNRAARAHKFPPDFKPNETHTQMAEESRTDLIAAFEAFRDFHTSKGSKFIDWDAAFRTWLRNEKRFGTTPAQGAGNGKRSRAEQAFDAIDRD